MQQVFRKCLLIISDYCSQTYTLVLLIVVPMQHRLGRPVQGGFIGEIMPDSMSLWIASWIISTCSAIRRPVA